MFQFNDLEISLFNNSYFSNFSYRNGIIEVQSISTGHWWKFQKIQMPMQNKIKIWHKYKRNDSYHVQCHVNYATKVHAYIIGHDKYILKMQESVLSVLY